MPQDNPRSENPRTESGRTERFRSDKSATNTLHMPFGEIGSDSVKAGLRAQKELLDVLHHISQDWFARATTEAELAFRLPSRLTSAPTVSDAFSAYHEWLNEWMSMRSEDGRRLLSDSQKIVDTGVRCFAVGSPATTS
jgi:uncharacterized protein YciW